MEDLILCTDWEEVPTDDFYLSDDWNEFSNLDDEQRSEIIEKAENKRLYYGYIVSAKNYCIYYQMDSSQVLIDEDMNVILCCETAIIDNDMKEKIEYIY